MKKVPSQSFNLVQNVWLWIQYLTLINSLSDGLSRLLSAGWDFQTLPSGCFSPQSVGNISDSLPAISTAKQKHYFCFFVNYSCDHDIMITSTSNRHSGTGMCVVIYQTQTRECRKSCAQFACILILSSGVATHVWCFISLLKTTLRKFHIRDHNLKPSLWHDKLKTGQTQTR